eukprot:TRINITY_DN16077_c0_g1_i1.p1 TRINITY_DN16077_c0_g1~~TRINITY_DN16077_c0_g1_i1.p1  ORF type:complete len:209 (-),score=56.56 TRINITY_DN16077_c0_g1_i1:73-699(-)
MGALCSGVQEDGLSQSQILAQEQSPGGSPLRGSPRTPKKRNKISVLLLGDCGTGKTALIRRLVHPVLSKTSREASTHPTSCVEYEQMRLVVDERSWVIRVWDVPGGTLEAKGLNCSPPPYSTVDIVVLVYAVDAGRSFEHLEAWRQWVLAQVQPGATFMLLGCKADKWFGREVNKQDVADFAFKHRISTEQHTLLLSLIHISEPTRPY